MIPSYGLCTIPPCEEFAENVCDESPATLPVISPVWLRCRAVTSYCIVPV